MDTCAAVSVTPPNVFQAPIKVTSKTGEAYRNASGGMIINEGTQAVDAMTNNWYNANANFQVCDVHRPLWAGQDAKAIGNSILISPQIRRLVFQ